MNFNKLSDELNTTLAFLDERLKNSSDFILHKLSATKDGAYRVAICYMDGLVDHQLVTKLIWDMNQVSWEEKIYSSMETDWIKAQLSALSSSSVYTEDDLMKSILNGRAVVIIHGINEAFVATVNGGSRRAVEEPTSQTVIRGPKEGFTEDITTNIALVRRKIKSPDLCVKSQVIGRYTQTKVSLIYIDGIANPEVVKEISSRLNSIETDSILESGYIEEFIQDGILSPFPTMINTERPDTVAGGLLEGLVAVVVDGTPFVLLAPVTFFRFLVSSEDYYQRFDISSFLRMVRLASFFIALLLPSLFIATTTFQQEMLPTTLLITLAAQRESTPLPALMEALIMELTFEIIREAGVRMPRAIGPAISIVGALVLGQAAVQAGLVSAAMVIVVSFTAIANFVLPAINMAATVRLLRFFLMFLAGTFGLYGILIGLVPILAHLVSLESFGIPYLMPLSPFNKSNLKDLFIRAPWWKIKTRPVMIGDMNPKRVSDKQKSFAQRAKDHKRDPLS
nr:spore germination protein [Paenibacillus sp. IHB B 3415]